MKKLMFVCTTILTMVMAAATVSAADLKSAIAAGVNACETAIDVSSFNATPEQAMDAYFELLNSDPNFFCVDESVGCTVNGNTAVALNVTYTSSKENIAKCRAEMNAAVAKIAQAAAGEATNLDKAKVVHDYFINNTEYDHSMAMTTSYDLLVKGKGVCGGYSLGYKMVMDQLGIPCQLVTSKTMNHQWNAVQIDGKWYNVDVTWDENYTESLQTVSYDNFMKSDSFFNLMGHNGGTSSVQCADSTFDMGIA